MATDALGHVCVQLIKCAIEFCEKYQLISEVFRPPCCLAAPCVSVIFLPCCHRGWSLQATNLKNAARSSGASQAGRGGPANPNAPGLSIQQQQQQQPPQPHTAAHGQNQPQQFPQAQGQLQPHPAHLASSAPIATAVLCI
jgi:hypothetical protein